MNRVEALVSDPPHEQPKRQDIPMQNPAHGGELHEKDQQSTEDR